MKQAIAVLGSKRRRHSEEFKARVVAQCKPPGVSVSAIALANGLNANLVRRWLNKSGVTLGSGVAPASKATVDMAPRDRSAQFIPLPIPSGPREMIHVEVVRDNTRVCIDWPVSAADAAAAWLRDVVR